MKTLSPTLNQLVEILNDGEYHSGSVLGESLNITRSAIGKCVGQLEKYGISINSVKGKGYQLQQPLILLDADKIKTTIDNKKLLADTQIDVYGSISSTNDYWKTPGISQAAPWHVCLAEQQTAGRGRLGRTWACPFAANIYCSLAWEFTRDMSELAGLSLVVGLAVVRTLEKLGLKEHLKIKWPNDILYDNQKLAGILIEINTQAHSLSQVVIGIGLNVNQPRQTHIDIDQQWVSLESITGNYQDRNHIIGALLNQLIPTIQQFSDKGLVSFIAEWQKYDYLAGNKISFIHQQKKIVGTALGIDEHGYLRLQTKNGQSITYSAGDASMLRKVKK